MIYIISKTRKDDNGDAMRRVINNSGVDAEGRMYVHTKTDKLGTAWCRKWEGLFTPTGIAWGDSPHCRVEIRWVGNPTEWELHAERGRGGRGRKPNPAPAPKPVPTPAPKPAPKPVPDGVVRHHKFDQCVELVKRGINLYLFGPAGTGKSELAAQIGEELGLEVYQIGAIKDVYSLRGYGDAGGNYVETSFYKAYAHGGLLIIDEADSIDPEPGLELNGALSQGVYDFPIIGNVKRHENFRVIFTGNTNGTGATEEYTGRNCLDAALLNRCFMVEIDYDENIEKHIVRKMPKPQSIVDFAHQLRKVAKDAGITLVISYRNLSQLAALRDVISKDVLFEGAITKGLPLDEKRILANALPSCNQWCMDFKNWVAAAS